MTGLTLAHCPDPECLAPAEVVDVYELRSTHGPVRHVVTVCVRRHRYMSVE